MNFMVFILISFVASLTNYLDKKVALYLLLFPPFLLLVYVCEYAGLQLRIKSHNNVWLYNIVSIVEFLFYFFFFHSVYRVSTARKVMLILIPVYLAAALLNIFLVQGKAVFHTYSYMAGCLFVIAGSIYYFLELFRYPQTGSIMRDPAFWITTALLFYYICVLPIFGIVNYISSIPKRVGYTLVFINQFSNIILYSLFTLAFLCKLSFRKYMS